MPERVLLLHFCKIETNFSNELKSNDPTLDRCKLRKELAIDTIWSTIKDSESTCQIWAGRCSSLKRSNLGEMSLNSSTFWNHSSFTGFRVSLSERRFDRASHNCWTSLFILDVRIFLCQMFQRKVSSNGFMDNNCGCGRSVVIAHSERTSFETIGSWALYERFSLRNAPCCFVNNVWLQYIPKIEYAPLLLLHIRTKDFWSETEMRHNLAPKSCNVKCK